jgi:hypothetical protein
VELKDILSSCPHEDRRKILELAPKVANELAAEIQNVGLEVPDVPELLVDEASSSERNSSPSDFDDSLLASDTELLISRRQHETSRPRREEQRQRLVALELAPHMAHSPKFVAKLTVALLTVCLWNYSLAAATVVLFRGFLSWLVLLPKNQRKEYATDITLNHSAGSSSSVSSRPQLASS